MAKEENKQETENVIQDKNSQFTDERKVSADKIYAGVANFAFAAQNSETSAEEASALSLSQTIEKDFLKTVQNELQDKGWDISTVNDYAFSTAVDASIAKNASLMTDTVKRIEKNHTSLTEVNKNTPAVKKELKNNYEYLQNIEKNFCNNVLEDVRHDFFEHQIKISTNDNNANKKRIFEQAFNNSVKQNPEFSQALKGVLQNVQTNKELLEDAKENISFAYKKKKEITNVISNNLKKLSRIGKTAWQKFSSFMKSVYDKGKNAVKYVGQKLVDFYHGVTKAISNLTTNVKQSAQKLGNKMSSKFSSSSNKGPQKDIDKKPTVTA
ncbi:MAG: hypothetical protein ISN64_03215 [Rickettsia sp.]|nr:hypothetical protein [Rickettsia sp.]